MNEIQENKFDYNLVDEETAEFLQQKEDNIKRSVGRAAYEIGKELKEAHSKVVGKNKYSKSTFKEWYESLGLSESSAYSYMNYYKAFQEELLPEEELKKLPIQVIQDLRNANDEIKQKVKNGEVETKREYWELKKKIRQEQKQKEHLQEQVEKLKNQEPEEIEKEIIPDDYHDIKEKAERLERAHRFMSEEKEKLDKQLREMKREKRETENRVKKYQDLQSQIEKLKKRKDNIGRQVESTMELTEFVHKIDSMLKNELSPVKYSDHIINQLHDDVVVGNLKEVLSRVKSWCDDLEKVIDTGKNYYEIRSEN